MNTWEESYEDIWKQLKFDPKKASKQRVQEWRRESKKVLTLFKEQNLGVIADTSAGKTIIALMVCLATKARVIFVTPQVILPKQNQKVLNEITKNNSLSRIITGETKTKDRVWNNNSEKFVFATPQTAVQEIKKARLDLNYFQILVVDEFHMAVGSYDYVELANLADNLGLRILGLSASPGNTFKKVKTVCENCRITKLKRLNIKTAPKELQKVEVPVDDFFVKLDIDFRDYLEKTKIELYEGLNKKPPTGVLTSKQLDSVLDLIKKRTEKKSRLRFESLKLYGIYRKLIHSYRTVVIDTYDTFLTYAEKLQKEKSASAREIVKTPEFQKIVHFVKYRCFVHPKVKCLSDLLISWVDEKKNGLVFIYQKNTAKYLAEELEKRNIKTAVITSSDSKKTHQQEEVLAKLAEKKIDVVISTTILQMGISVPEIDAVFHYDLPSSIIAKIQKDGRTGRIRAGTIFYLVLEHIIDKQKYISVLNQLRRMHNAIDLFNQESEKSLFLFKNKEIPFLTSAIPKKAKKRSLDSSQQLDLF